MDWPECPLPNPNPERIRSLCPGLLAESYPGWATWIDLTQEPVILSVPAITNRYSNRYFTFELSSIPLEGSARLQWDPLPGL